MFRKSALTVCLAAFSAICVAQTPPPFVGLGDSLGEGDQSADANQRTQPHGYLNLIAKQMGVSFPLPLIKTNPHGQAGSTNNRYRIDPTVKTYNLAVSGATSGSILTDAVGSPIDDETDLVLTPYSGTQIQVAQSLQSPFMICWIGNNDALSAVLAFNHLTGKQVTPLATFQSNFHQVVQGLSGWGAKVVFANIPDVTKVGFMMSNKDLITFLGNDYGLPDGSLTTVEAMILVKFGSKKPTVFQNPNWVLDAKEISKLRRDVKAFNDVIAQETSQAGFAMVDAHELFNHFVANPPVFPKVTLTNRFNGGLFSLDGAHPSNIGYALVANAFINKANSFYGMNIPRIKHSELRKILRTDPFVDFNRDLVVRGRPKAGILETLGPMIGISGDKSDIARHRGIDPALGRAFMRAYFSLMGRDPNTPYTDEDMVAAVAHTFGVDRYVQ